MPISVLRIVKVCMFTSSYGQASYDSNYCNNIIILFLWIYAWLQFGQFLDIRGKLRQNGHFHQTSKVKTHLTLLFSLHLNSNFTSNKLIRWKTDTFLMRGNEFCISIKCTNDFFNFYYLFTWNDRCFCSNWFKQMLFAFVARCVCFMGHALFAALEFRQWSANFKASKI